MENIKLKHLYGNSTAIYPRNVVYLYKVLLKGCPIFLNSHSMCNFVKLATEIKFHDIALGMLKLYEFYRDDDKVLELLQENLVNPDLQNYNPLNRVVFIVEDFDLLIKKLDLVFIYKVNKGIQK